MAAVEDLAGVALFDSLSDAQREDLAGWFHIQNAGEGIRLVGEGAPGYTFFVILDGTADVRIDVTSRSTLHRGDFFGEVSILLGEPPTADIVAMSPLSCLLLGPAAVSPFLLSHPQVMFRMLQAQARRLRNANRWRS